MAEEVLAEGRDPQLALLDQLGLHHTRCDGTRLGKTHICLQQPLLGRRTNRVGNQRLEGVLSQCKNSLHLELCVQPLKLLEAPLHA